MALILQTDLIIVEVDDSFGADITRLIDIPTGENLLFTSPWQDRAARAIERARSVASDTRAAWMATYRGGWQLLFPNAGPERRAGGVLRGFHGEAAVAPWTLIDHGPRHATLSLELTTVPCRITRRIVVRDSTLEVIDSVANESETNVEIDYVQHPAFGGAFVQGPVRLEAAARTFVVDPEDAGALLVPGTRMPWPVEDVAAIPPAPDVRSAFGYLTDFSVGQASLISEYLELRVDLDWDHSLLPHAWLWQEFSSSMDWPWFGRARVVAIEPASSPTSGDGRIGVPFSPRESKTFTMSMTIRREATL